MDTEHKTILIIDQNESDHAQMQRSFSLQDSPPELIFTTTITEALQQIQASVPDIIICDYFFNDGNASVLLLSSLIQNEIPVVIFTDKNDVKLSVNALKCGAIDYQIKTTETYTNLPDIIQKNLTEWFEQKQKEKTQRELSLSESRLTEALSIAEMGNWEWNQSSNELYCSKEIFSMLGIANANFNNGFNGFLQYVHQDDREVLTQTLDSVITNKKPFILEIRLNQSTSNELTIKIQGKADLNENGEVFRLSGIMQNITHSHETFKQLHLLAAALEASADSIIITDINGNIVWANPAMTRLTGFKYSELIGQTPRIWSSHSHDKATFDELWKTILSGQTWQSELINCKKNGEQYLEEQTITSVLNECGEISHFVAIKKDISERKESEAKNLQAAQVFEHSIEGILICDSNNSIIRVNPAFSKITGYSEDEIIGKKPSILKSGNHDEVFFSDMWTTLAQQGMWQGEVWNRRKNGETYPELLTISTIKDNENKVIEYIAIFADITDRKQDAEQIHRLAFFDSLTNLPNRTLSHEILKNTLDLRSTKQDLIGVLSIDIDRFFIINETLGHDAGDKLLQIIVRRINRCNDEMDKVGRISSDEFTVICPDINSPAQLAKKAQRILDSIAQPIMLNNQEIFITASIGIAISPADGNEETILFRHAESARQHAKKEGNSYQFFSDEMNLYGFEKLVMKSSLRRALERNEFELHYQPQIEIKTGKLIGAEALIRWRHPDLGLVPPDKFIPILEETGLIAEVGSWVLRTACQQNKDWQFKNYPAIQIAVNLSPRQFRQKELVSSIQTILSEVGLPAECLELEVTESSIMDNPEEVTITLKSLHDLGIKLSIDDFGTGYSSLNYLKTFPIDALKIDRSFIRDITHDSDDETIVKTIIAMGHNLDLKIIAEGVEQQEQLKLIENYDCDWYQGNFYSSSMTASDFENLLIKKTQTTKQLETVI